MVISISWVVTNTFFTSVFFAKSDSNCYSQFMYSLFIYLFLGNLPDFAIYPLQPCWEGPSWLWCDSFLTENAPIISGEIEEGEAGSWEDGIWLQKRDIYLEGRRRHFLRKLDRYLGRTLGWSQGAAFFVPWQLSYLTRPFLHPFLIRMVAEKGTYPKWPQIFGGRYLEGLSGEDDKQISYSILVMCFNFWLSEDIWQWLMALSLVFNFWAEGGGRGSAVI